MDTRLTRRAHGPGSWVRSVESGRTLGVVERIGSRWSWEPVAAAFRGDGRPGLQADGAPTDRVPSDLVQLPADRRVVRTREKAVEALVSYLTAQEAPVLGCGPHRRVQPGLRRLEEVAIRGW